MLTIPRTLLLTLFSLLSLTACTHQSDTELSNDALAQKYGKVVAMDFHLQGSDIEEMISHGRSDFTHETGKVKTSPGNWQLDSMGLVANEAGRVLLHIKGRAKTEGPVTLSFWTFWTDQGKVGPGLYESKMAAGETIDRVLVGEQVYMKTDGRVAPMLELEKIENLQLEQIDVLVLKGRSPDEYRWTYVYLAPALIFAIFGFWFRRR